MFVEEGIQKHAYLAVFKVRFVLYVSDSFEIKSGVKQGCVLAPTLFGIFFSILLKHAFNSSTTRIKLNTRTDGHLFNPSNLRAKQNLKIVTIRDLLFADDAALVAYCPRPTDTAESVFFSMLRFWP